jgi:hypothetical protein
VPEGLLNSQLGEPHHYAYVVDGIEATVDRLFEQFGAGPFFRIENVPLEDVVSGGEPAEFAHSSAFGRCGEATTTLHDAAATLGHDIEIHADNEGLRGFFEMVSGAARGWDGSEPLRSVEL